MLGSQKCLGWTALTMEQIKIRVLWSPSSRMNSLPVYMDILSSTTHRTLSVHQGNRLLQWILFWVFAVLQNSAASAQRVQLLLVRQVPRMGYVLSPMGLLPPSGAVQGAPVTYTSQNLSWVRPRPCQDRHLPSESCLCVRKERTISAFSCKLLSVR